MKKVLDYRRQAADCRAMAKQMSLHEHRDRLLRMAEEWELAAEQREAELRKQAKPKPLAEK
jgi:hypothetical protein